MGTSSRWVHRRSYSAAGNTARRWFCFGAWAFSIIRLPIGHDAARIAAYGYAANTISIVRKSRKVAGAARARQSGGTAALRRTGRTPALIYGSRMDYATIPFIAAWLALTLSRVLAMKSFI